jgi:hypothetical protein
MTCAGLAFRSAVTRARSYSVADLSRTRMTGDPCGGRPDGGGSAGGLQPEGRPRPGLRRSGGTG